jgi:hypothetical protein
VRGLRPTPSFLFVTKKVPKPDNANLISVLQRTRDGVQDSVDRLGCIGAGEAGHFRDLRNEIILVHVWEPF